MYAQLSAPPPLLTSMRPGLSPQVDDVIQRALAKAPDDRHPSCGGFAGALRVALGLRRYTSDTATALHPQALTGHTAPPAAHPELTASAAARRSDEAIELYQRTSADQRHMPGPDYPDGLATWLSTAQELAARGDHACGARLFGFAPVACQVGDHRRVVFSAVCVLTRYLLGCLMVPARREVSKDAELLVLRHENTVLGRQVGRVRYQPGNRLWLAALSRLIPRHCWGQVFAVTPRHCSPGMGAWSHVNGIMQAGSVPDGRPRQPRSARS